MPQAEAAADLRGALSAKQRQWPDGAVRIQSCTLLLQLQTDGGPPPALSQPYVQRACGSRSTDQWRRAACLTDGPV